MSIKREAGFSLAEVMVSLALVVTVATIFLTVYFSGVQAAKKSEMQLATIMKLQDELEKYKSTLEIAVGEKTENNITHVISIDKQSENKALYIVSVSTKAGNKTMTMQTKLYRQVSP